jgi:V/A-type H+/Na+-transporting ATPase subunit K
MRRTVRLAIPGILVFLSIVFGVSPVWAQTTSQSDFAILAAAIVAGLAFAGAGIGLGIAGSAAIGAVSEKPEMFSLTFVYIVFVEAIAVYGLVLAFLMLGRA